LNQNVWKSFKCENINKGGSRPVLIFNGQIMRKTLNQEQAVEYDFIKKLSEKLIFDNYGRNPTFRCITKTSIGYSLMRLFYHAIKNVSIKIQSNIKVCFNLKLSNK